MDCEARIGDATKVALRRLEMLNGHQGLAGKEKKKELFRSDNVYQPVQCLRC